jgi:AcrR family transcriptional regulator
MPDRSQAVVGEDFDEHEDESLSEWLLHDERESPPRPRGPRRGKTRQPRSRRSTILDAALTLFNEAGYGRASMQDIAAEAGASIGSIYHHFGSKEEVAAAVHLAGLADYQRGLGRVLRREHDSAEAAVKAVVHHHLGWVKSNRELARFLFTSREPEVVGVTARALNRMNAAAFREVQEWVERWVEEGAIRPLPFGLLHSVLLGPSQEFSRHWVAGRVRESIEEAESVLADAAWKAVRA